jgi:hypothetical protein
MADDDDKWLARLRGKSREAQNVDEQRAAEALRAEIRRVNDTTEVRHDGPRELERLLFRLRKERLLDARSESSWKRALPMSAVAIVVAGIATTMVWQSGLFQPGGDDFPIMRGGAPQLIDADDPAKAAEQLLATLKKFDIPAQHYEIGTTVGVMAKVPAEKAESVRSALTPLGASLPSSGELRVEFRRKAAR